MIIKNYEQLAISDLRKDALSIVDAGLDAINTPAVIRKMVSVENQKLLIDGNAFDRINNQRVYVVGVGKCALDACTELEKILGDSIVAGIVVDVRPGTLLRLKTFTGSHPYPTEKNVDATAEIIQMLKDCRQDDLVLFVISGGGSTLLCQPDNMTCLDEEKLLRTLFSKAATIEEINLIRKHLSLARGGFLAKYAFPAKSVALIFSDVPGNDLTAIASGPTVFDPTTISDAKKVLLKYGISDISGLVETPKDPGLFSQVKNILVVSNQVALNAMNNKGAELGYKVKIVTNELLGEAREVGADITERINGEPSKTLLLYAGETTVTILGNGQGGRNQELVMGALNKINDDSLVISLASDGRDNGDHAGAISDVRTMEKVRSFNLNSDEFLSHNDSFNFFAKTGDYILTGPTGSNVSDLVLALKK